MTISIRRKLIIGGIFLLLTDLAVAAAVFTPESQPVGWVSRPEVSYFNLSSGTEAFYQIDYRKDTGAGNVLPMTLITSQEFRPRALGIMLFRHSRQPPHYWEVRITAQAGKSQPMAILSGGQI